MKYFMFEITLRRAVVAVEAETENDARNALDKGGPAFCFANFPERGRGPPANRKMFYIAPIADNDE